jgi:hypothetical protein
MTLRFIAFGNTTKIHVIKLKFSCLLTATLGGLIKYKIQNNMPYSPSPINGMRARVVYDNDNLTAQGQISTDGITWFPFTKPESIYSLYPQSMKTRCMDFLLISETLPMQGKFTEVKLP